MPAKRPLDMVAHPYLSRGLAIILCIHGGQAAALMTYHEREPLKVSGWSEELAEIVNDKARLGGRIGPYGPSAEFQYSGGVEAFQRVLERFARLPGQKPCLYLHPGAGIPQARQQNPDPHDFALSIAVTGEGSLHVYVGRIPLESMKIPPNVVVAAVPELSVQPASGDEGAAKVSVRIAAFVKEREARAKTAR